MRENLEKFKGGGTNPLDLNPDIAIGISIPIGLGNNGYFNSTYTTLDAAKANIRNLLLTQKGERVMQPDFGTNLRGILFEPMSENLPELIRSDIQQSIKKWLPYVVVDTVDVVVSDDGVVKVDVLFTTKSDPDTLDSVTFGFHRAGE